MTTAGLPPGLLAGGGGFLRRSIEVAPQDDGWSLTHSFWELSVPGSSLRDASTFEAFLARKIPVGELDHTDREVGGLISLLAAQGCLTFDGARQTYARAEVDFIVQSAINSWYGTYYRHPFWQELIACRVSKAQLFGWLLRTYHLSRSVGATAARGAIHSSSTEARATFLKNSLEEYAHCQDYYLPVHTAFGLDEPEVTSFVPFPSSTAFDHQMGIIAEDDWLAHAIVALFQEQTTTYRANAYSLYDLVAKAYGLGDFFESWKAHVGYDVAESHADEFRRLIRHRSVPRARLTGSLRAAATTVEYLIGALDELASLPQHAEIHELRPSRPLGRSPPSTRDWSLPDHSRDLAKAGSSSGKVAELAAAALNPARFAPIMLRAMSRAERHGDVIHFGHALLQLTDSKAASESEMSPSVAAILNFLREHAGSPRTFGFLALLLFDLARGARPGGASMADLPAERPLRDWASEIHPEPQELENLEMVGAHFIELCAAGTHLWRRSLALDILAD